MGGRSPRRSVCPSHRRQLPPSFVPRHLWVHTGAKSVMLDRNHMSNVTGVLNQQIFRLTRREIQAQTG